MAITKLVVLGKEISLPKVMTKEEISEKLLSILSDIDQELVNELKNKEYSLKIEGEIAIVYRLGAVFG